MNKKRFPNYVAMEEEVQVFSEAFCPINITDHFTVAVSEDFWREIMNHHQEGRCFLHIQIGDKVWIAPVGHPVSSTITRNPCVYVPLWMLDSAGFQGVGEMAMCSVFDNQAFPHASKISLKVIDSAFYTSEVKEELEKALTAMGVVRSESILQIPIQSLSGFRVEVFITKTEPSDIILCEGEEVVIEFEEPVDHYEPPPRVPTPIPLEEPMLLAGDQATRFQGEGRRLGGSNSEIPEWRRNLPPPPRRQP